MADMSHLSEIGRVLARPDFADLLRQIRSHYDYYKAGFHDDDPDRHDDIMAVLAATSDPEKSLAYAVVASREFDDPAYLSFVALDMLEENILYDPSDEMLDRIIAEGRRSPRIRWMLSAVRLQFIAERARAPVAEVVDMWTTQRPLPPSPSP